MIIRGIFWTIAELRPRRNEGTIVGAIPRQCVQATAVIAAALFLGVGQARAGYVSLSQMAENEGGSPLTPPLVSPMADFGASTNPRGSSAASQSRPDTDSPQAPSEPVPPSRKLPDADHNFGHSGGAGSSSRSVTGNGPSSPLASDATRPQTSLLEFTGLLPPPKGDAHSFSAASFLFRPPRAV
jgi:hypothetical protein